MGLPDVPVRNQSSFLVAIKPHTDARRLTHQRCCDVFARSTTSHQSTSPTGQQATPTTITTAIHQTDTHSLSLSLSLSLCVCVCVCVCRCFCFAQSAEMARTMITLMIMRRTAMLFSVKATSLLVIFILLTTTEAFLVHSIQSKAALTYKRSTIGILSASQNPSSSSSSSSSAPSSSSPQPRSRPQHQGDHQNRNNPNRQKYNNNNRRGGPRDPKCVNTKTVNSQILDCESGNEILTVLSSTTGALMKLAGGGVLRPINFSTSIHRISKSISRNQRERKAVLSNP